MNATALVQYGVLVRVVSCAGADKLGRKCALACQRLAWYHDHPTFPCNGCRVDENSSTRVFGDIRINVLVAGVVYAGAIAYLLVVRRPREVPPFPPRTRRAVAPERPPAHAVEADDAPDGVAPPAVPDEPRHPAPAAAGEAAERADQTP